MRVFILNTFVVLVLFSANELKAQFRHLHYNLTLYGNPFGCEESTNNSSDKEAWLKTIVSYAEPDIITVNELRDQNIWADRILNNSLNPITDNWARASLTYQVTWSSIINAFFYREDKFTLYDQEVVYQNLDGGNLLRPIDFYTLYLNDTGLTQGDTTFITCVVAHLAASDAVERAEQTEAAMAHIAELGPKNYIFSGDLNMDDAFEEAFQNLISADDPNLSLIDPLSISNYWNNNSAVSQHHTQSTRFSDTNSGCMAGGGLDDRFDITLISPFVNDGLDGVHYVEGSYKALGQSGFDYNQELQTIGNSVVPDSVAIALYEMSDHLPVLTEYNTELVLSIIEYTDALLEVSILGSNQLRIQCNLRDFYLSIYDISGRRCLEQKVSRRNTLVDYRAPTTGWYVINVYNADSWISKKVYLSN